MSSLCYRENEQSVPQLVVWAGSSGGHEITLIPTSIDFDNYVKKMPFPHNTLSIISGKCCVKIETVLSPVNRPSLRQEDRMW